MAPPSFQFFLLDSFFHELRTFAHALTGILQAPKKKKTKNTLGNRRISDPTGSEVLIDQRLIISMAKRKRYCGSVHELQLGIIPCKSKTLWVVI